MRLLLDSPAYLWWVLEHPRLSAATVDVIATAAEVFVSFVTPWEFEIKVAAGKLNLPSRIWSDFAADRFAFLTATLDDCLLAARLLPHHRDPFDRMIIAQALNRGLTVVTSDQTFDLYGVSILQTHGA